MRTSRYMGVLDGIKFKTFFLVYMFHVCLAGFGLRGKRDRNTLLNQKIKVMKQKIYQELDDTIVNLLMTSTNKLHNRSCFLLRIKLLGEKFNIDVDEFIDYQNECFADNEELTPNFKINRDDLLDVVLKFYKN